VTDSQLTEALASAISAIGGTPREGQVTMAEAIETALGADQHLLIQAGTGTGKSLGYLIPVLLHVAKVPERRAVVATATLALQAQLATKDIPIALDAVATVTGRRPTAAVLKGRSNYACLLRVHDGIAPEQESLLGDTELAGALRSSGADEVSVRGAEVVALRRWVEEQADGEGLADRDDAPPHSPLAWAQVSVPPLECIGAQRCPYGDVCFVERSRDVARRSDLVVTNHSLLAIDAMHGGTALPPHDLVVIDEAHELSARVTSTVAVELTPGTLERLARRALLFLSDDELALAFLETGDELRSALDSAPASEITDSESTVFDAVRIVRDVCRRVVSALGGDPSNLDRVQCAAAVGEAFDIAERMSDPAPTDVCWISDSERFGRGLHLAPLSVAGLMRNQIFTERPVVLTSATLTVGGDFTVSAGSVGLRVGDRVPAPGEDLPAAEAVDDDTQHLAWAGIDVGSPFDYRVQGILYIARQLPPPARDGMGEAVLKEIVELMTAAEGRTLGLFSSQRAALTAAAHVREHCPDLEVLCQGDAHLPDLTRRFVEQPGTSLFGTLSLWQGVDVPGSTCELVIIDRIPFPRPDEPLQQARQRAVSAAGGNGFMQVVASQAALLLAQGTGRLIRRSTDRGVVAVRDPRLATARYGGFLRASLPDFWTTYDPAIAQGALGRLRQAGS
jgi:ATP-dependent DNA helicase DinG